MTRVTTGLAEGDLDPDPSSWSLQERDDTKSSSSGTHFLMTSISLMCLPDLKYHFVFAFLVSSDHLSRRILGGKCYFPYFTNEDT